MRGIRSVRKYMRQTLTIAPATGQDVSGDNTYSTSPTTYQCRLVGKRRRVWDADGEMTISSQTAYLASGDNVLPSAQVVLSTADVGSTEGWALSPPIVGTGRYPGRTGRHVYTALFLRAFVPPILLFLATGGA